MPEQKKASITTDSFLEIYTVFDNAFIAPKSLNMFALDNTLTLELQPLDFSNDIDWRRLVNIWKLVSKVSY